MGEATSRILGLNRRWLEEERRIHLLEMRRIRNMLINKLNMWTEENQPFAGMARAFLELVREEVANMESG